MADNFLRFKPCQSCCVFSCVLGQDKYNCVDSLNSELWNIKSGSWSVVDQTPFYCGSTRWAWQWNGSTYQWNQIDSDCSKDCGVSSPPTTNGTYANEQRYVPCVTGTNTDKIKWTFDGADWQLTTNNCRYPTDEGYTACPAIKPSVPDPPPASGTELWIDCQQFKRLSGSGGMILWKGNGRTENVHISVSATGVNCGDTFRIVFDYEDEDNYKFAQFEMGASGHGTNSLYERVSGTDTLISTCRSYWIETTPTRTFKVCYTPNPNNPTEQVITAGDGLHTATYATIEHETVGLAVTSGTITFDNFLVHKHHTATGNTATCNYCGLGGWGCFPNVSSHTLTSGIPQTITVTDQWGNPWTTGNDWSILQSFYTYGFPLPFDPVYIITGAIDAEFEFTLMKPFHPTFVFAYLYFRNTNRVTTTGRGTYTPTSNSGDVLLNGSASWSHAHTDPCNVQVYNHTNGAWEIAPFNTIQDSTTRELYTVDSETGDADRSKASMFLLAFITNIWIFPIVARFASLQRAESW